MLEDIQELVVTETEQKLAPGFPRTFSRPRGRRLSAIEIAEGALLADVGVVFQLLIWFVPILGEFLQLLVPVIFAVIVLRRGLYVGVMSLCVAFFIIIIVLGPHGLFLLLLEAGAGLFLGVTMRSRLLHSLTIAVGVMCGGLALNVILLLLSFLSGGPMVLVRGIRVSYEQLLPVLNALFKLVSLDGFWQTTLLPLFNNFMQWGLHYWFVLLYLVCCLTCIPVVILVYFLTNFFVRLLGYQVRPFPGLSMEGRLYGLLLRLFRYIPRRAFARFSLLRSLRREAHRVNRARLRQLRREKEAREQL